MNLKVKKIILVLLLIIIFVGGTVWFIDYVSYLEKGKFVYTGEMLYPRIHHSAVLMQDGRVLITGGLIPKDEYKNGRKLIGSKPTNTAEIYDPKTKKFAQTDNMIYSREHHTSTLLSDGRVLIAGGRHNHKNTASAEVYDPKTGKFTETGKMNIGRISHSATLLNDGRVLIIGGGADLKLDPTSIVHRYGEIYNPQTEKFTLTERIPHTVLFGSTTILLPDGNVFVVGFWDSNAVLLYNPEENKFIEAGEIVQIISNAQIFTTLMSDKVYIFTAKKTPVGITTPFPSELDLVSIYDIKTRVFSELKLALKVESHNNYPLGYPRAIPLRNGKILISLSLPETGFDKVTILYDIDKNEFTRTGKMNKYTYGYTTTLLNDGNVLFTGGIEETPFQLIAKLTAMPNMLFGLVVFHKGNEIEGKSRAEMVLDFFSPQKIVATTYIKKAKLYKYYYKK